MPNFAVMPSLRFADLRAALDFYTNTLGFALRRGTAEEGNIALDFGDASLMIEGAGTFYSEGFNAAIRERLGRGGPNSLYMEAPELDALYERARAAGASIVDPLAERPWGQSEFTVEDPGGNWLTFWKAS